MTERSDSAAAAQAASGTLDPRLMQLAPEDNVAVAKSTLPAGAAVIIGGRSIVLGEAIPTGHKVAIARIVAGEKVRKYGAPIGSATREIQPGQYVHTHNVKSDYLPTYTRDNRAPG
jgi:altronate dehydratase small subunit